MNEKIEAPENYETLDGDYDVCYSIKLLLHCSGLRVSREQVE